MIADEGDKDAMSKTVNVNAFEQQLSAMRVVDYGYSDVDASLPENADSAKGDVRTINFDCSLQTIYHKNFDLIARSFRQFLDDGYRLLILSDTVHQTDRLHSIF